MRRRLVCLAAVLGGLVSVPGLYADGCASSTNCTYIFDTHNSSSSLSPSPFGTVNLQLLSSTEIQFTIDLASGFKLIGTGFPGAFGFNEVGAPPNTTFTYGNFKSGDTVGTLATTTAYSGGSDTDDTNGPCAHAGQHFDGFGCFDHVGATTAPSAGSSDAKNVVQFTVTRGSGTWTNVHSLVDLANPAGGDGAAYFVADVFQSTNCTGSCTGLIAVSDVLHVQSVPEPTTYAGLLAGFGALVFFVQRRRKTSASTE